MANNAQKTPFAESINRFAEKKAQDAIQRLGKALPCHVTAAAGQIVTVAFDIESPPFTLPSVTMPINTWIYDWIPVRIGDKGYAVPADTYLGGVSGLGGGTANLVQRANLSTLNFIPVSNVSWQPPGGDALKRIIQGPNGVYLLDLLARVTALFDASNGIAMRFGSGAFTMATDGITLSFGDHSVVINETGVIIDGRVFLDHEHTDVQTGSDNTGGVV